MSIDIHEEPWLRDALSDIVGTEPAMASTLVDDVRRGESARASVRRRRVTTVAVAAVLALVAVPAGFLLRAQPHAAAPPVSSVSATPTVLSPSPTPRPSASGDGFVADADWESRVLTVLGGRVNPVLQHADLTAATLLVSGRLVQGDAGTFVLASVDQGSGAAAQLASPPCGLDDPRCVVLLPWGRVTTAQGPAWVSLVDITYTDVPHRMRVASVIRGDTTIMLSSDSRDVSADFSYSEGHGPGLEPDVIVADALSIPVPQSMRAAVARPTTTPPQSWPGSGGSGSASSDPGVAALPSCEISSMYVTIGPGTNGDTPGQRAFAVHLNYHGSTACRVSWPPTLTLTASDTLAGVAVDGAGRVPQSLPPTRFSPGDSATFTLSTSTCAGVVTARTVFVAIGLPGSSTVVGVVVPWDMGLDYCDGATTPGDHVSVSSLVVGTA